MEIPTFAIYRSEHELLSWKMEDLATDLFQLNEYASTLEATLKTQKGETNKDYINGLLTYINKFYKIKYAVYVKLSDAEFFKNDDYEEYKRSIETQALNEKYDAFWDI